MDISTVNDAVNQAFTSNPSATPQDIAGLVQSSGGLTADIASALANHYGVPISTVVQQYAQMTQPQQAAPVVNSPTNYSQATQQGLAKSGLDQTMSAVNSGSSINKIASSGLNPQPVTQPYKDASGNLVTPAPNTFVVSHPDGSGGALNYYFTADPKTGATAPIGNSQQNLTYTPGTSGSTLGSLLSNPIVQIGAGIASGGALTPYIAGANAVNAAANGNTLGALINAGIAGYTGGAFDNLGGGTSGTSSYDPNAGNPNYSLGNNSTAATGTGGTGLSGTGLNVQPGSTPNGDYSNLFNTSGYDTAGLQNGIGLQTPGSTNLADMGGGQGLTIPTATSASGVNNAILGASGTTNYGTGGLPVNQLTGQTLGNALSNTNTGVFTPSLTPIIPSPNGVGGGIVGGGGGGIVGGGGGGGSGSGVLGSGLSTAGAVGLGLGGASLLTNAATNKSISNASNIQTNAANDVNNVLANLYSQYAKAQQPYQNLGTGAVGEITNEAPYLTHQFNSQDLTAGLAPNYDFMLQQGQRANQNAANVSGGLLSGNTLQGMQNYTQNYAQNAYQNAFNNYQTQRQNIYNNLAGAAGMGQTSLSQLGNVGTNLANTYGNVVTGLAASQAGAQTAQAVNNANTLNNLAKTAAFVALA